MGGKKLILIVIDSLHPEALEGCFAAGTVPALAFLRQHGYYSPACVSVFPTMTPTAAASIATGQMPAAHGVYGFTWFDQANSRFVNYGISRRAIQRHGTRAVLADWKNMNRRHLRPDVPTVFESLEARNITTGCINFLIYRGGFEHPLKYPWMICLLTGSLPAPDHLPGPQTLVVGRTCYPAWLPVCWLLPRRFRQRYGGNDHVSGWAAVETIRQGRLPDFLLVYFPGTDIYAHAHGPMASAPAIQQVDAQIAAILDAFGDWQRALDEAAFIVVGDHSQSAVRPDREAIINLDRVLAKFRRLGLRNRHPLGQDLAVACNERMAYVDLLPGREHLLPEVVEALERAVGVDQIIWRDGERCRVRRQGRWSLSFQPGGPFTDDWGQTWNWTGDLQAVGATLIGTHLSFPAYPEAFGRIWGSLDAGTGARVCITAAPGYEFGGEGAALHLGGGSHGSLHREDSLTPLIVTGVDVDSPNPRVVDLAPLICKYFGVPLLTRQGAVQHRGGEPLLLPYK